MKIQKLMYVFLNLIALPAVIIPYFELAINIITFLGLIDFLMQKDPMALALISLILIKNQFKYKFDIYILKESDKNSKNDFKTVLNFALFCTINYILLFILLIKYIISK